MPDVPVLRRHLIDVPQRQHQRRARLDECDVVTDPVDQPEAETVGVEGRGGPDVADAERDRGDRRAGLIEGHLSNVVAIVG